MAKQAANKARLTSGTPDAVTCCRIDCEPFFGNFPTAFLAKPVFVIVDTSKCLVDAGEFGGALADAVFEFGVEPVQLRFGLPAALPGELTRLIKRADRAAAYLEATQLAGFTPSEAKRYFSRPRATAEVVLKPAPPAEVERRFLARFGELYDDRSSP